MAAPCAAEADATGAADLAHASPAGGRRRRRRRRLLTLGTAAAVLALAGAALVWRPQARPQLAREGAAAGFDLPRLGAPSERVTLDAMAGRSLVVNFWASWCVPCRNEMPVLAAVSEQLGGQVAFVGINHQDGKSAAARFEAETGVGYPSGYDPEGEVAPRYGVVGLPTTIFVGADGTIVGRRLGEVSDVQLRELIWSAFGIDVRTGATT